MRRALDICNGLGRNTKNRHTRACQQRKRCSVRPGCFTGALDAYYEQAGLELRNGFNNRLGRQPIFHENAYQEPSAGMNTEIFQPGRAGIEKRRGLSMPPCMQDKQRPMKHLGKRVGGGDGGSR